MDVFYLAIAYLATHAQLDERGGLPGRPVPVFYRLVGVVAFELTQHARAAAGLPEHLRVLLHRLRGHPLAVAHDRAWGLRWWIGVAAVHLGRSSSCRRSTGSTSRSSTSPTRWPTPLGTRRRAWPCSSPAPASLDLCGRRPGAGRPRLALRGRPAARGDRHRGRAGRPGTPSRGAVRSAGDAGEGGAPRPAVGHLRPDAPGVTPPTCSSSSASPRWSWSTPPHPGPGPARPDAWSRSP